MWHWDTTGIAEAGDGGEAGDVANAEEDRRREVEWNGMEGNGMEWSGIVTNGMPERSPGQPSAQAIARNAPTTKRPPPTSLILLLAA